MPWDLRPFFPGSQYPTSHKPCPILTKSTETTTERQTCRHPANGRRKHWTKGCLFQPPSWNHSIMAMISRSKCLAAGGCDGIAWKMMIWFVCRSCTNTHVQTYNYIYRYKWFCLLSPPLVIVLFLLLSLIEFVKALWIRNQRMKGCLWKIRACSPLVSFPVSFAFILWKQIWVSGGFSTSTQGSGTPWHTHPHRFSLLGSVQCWEAAFAEIPAILADHCSAFIPTGGTAISQDDEAVSHMSCMGVVFDRENNKSWDFGGTFQWRKFTSWL